MKLCKFCTTFHTQIVPTPVVIEDRFPAGQSTLLENDSCRGESSNVCPDIPDIIFDEQCFIVEPEDNAKELYPNSSLSVGQAVIVIVVVQCFPRDKQSRLSFVDDFALICPT